MQLRHVFGLVLSALALPACASGAPSSTEPPDTDPPPQIEFVRPTLRAVAPDAIQLGDTLEVLGSDFLAPEYGTMALRLSGIFADSTGAEQEFEQLVPLTYVNAGRATAVIEDDLLEIEWAGTFFGGATVVSNLQQDAVNAPAGTTWDSVQQGLTLTVLPSIQLTTLRSVDEDCAGVSRTTVTGTNIALGLRVLGWDDAFAGDPITVRIGIQAPNMTMQYVKDAEFDRPGPVDLEHEVYADAPEGTNTLTFTIEDGNTLLIDPRVHAPEADIDPAIRIGG
jgi:hypothetical protein